MLQETTQESINFQPRYSLDDAVQLLCGEDGTADADLRARLEKELDAEQLAALENGACIKFQNARNEHPEAEKFHLLLRMRIVSKDQDQIGPEISVRQLSALKFNENHPIPEVNFWKNATYAA